MRIVTHTPSERGRFYCEAIESAGRALAGSIASHEIIVVPPGEYYEARKAAWQSGGYVGLLDSDDTFPRGFLVRSFEPHLNGVGVVYGCEERIDSDGRRISDRSREATADDIAERATGIHHFALINTDCIEREVFEAVEREGAFLCLDWVVRAYAALIHGATFVDDHSYNWRQHAGQVTHYAQGAMADSVSGALRVINGYYLRRCTQWHRQTQR